MADAAPGATPRNLTADLTPTSATGWRPTSTRRGAARRSRPVWSRDGRSLIVAVAERGRVNLRRFDVATGKATPLTQGDQEVVSYTATPDGSRLALVISTPTVIGDL